MVRQGKAGRAGSGQAWWVDAWYVVSRQAGLGGARRGGAWLVKARQAG